MSEGRDSYGLAFMAVMFLFFVSLAGAVDWSPQGNVNLRGYYYLYGASNVSSNGGYWLFNYSNITNPPAYMDNVTVTFLLALKTNQLQTDNLESVIYNRSEAQYLCVNVTQNARDAAQDAAITAGQVNANDSVKNVTYNVDVAAWNATDVNLTVGLGQVNQTANGAGERANGSVANATYATDLAGINANQTLCVQNTTFDAVRAGYVVNITLAENLLGINYTALQNWTAQLGLNATQDAILAAMLGNWTHQLGFNATIVAMQADALGNWTEQLGLNATQDALFASLLGNWSSQVANNSINQQLALDAQTRANNSWDNASMSVFVDGVNTNATLCVQNTTFEAVRAGYVANVTLAENLSGINYTFLQNWTAQLGLNATQDFVLSAMLANWTNQLGLNATQDFILGNLLSNWTAQLAGFASNSTAIFNRVDNASFSVFRSGVNMNQTLCELNISLEPRLAGYANQSSTLPRSSGWSGVWSERSVYSTGVGQVVKRYAFNDSGLLFWLDLGDSAANETAQGYSIDLSGNNHAGTLGNSVATRPVLNTSSAVIGNSLNFSNRQFVNLSYTGVERYLNATTDWTVALWFKPEYSTSAGISTLWAFSPGGNRTGIITNGGKLYSKYYNGTYFGLYGSCAGAWNSWHFAVAVHHNNVTWHDAYCDGVLLSGGTAGYGSGGTAANYLGIDVGAVTGPFNGTIDDFKVWNRTLSQAEITNLYNQGNPSGYGGQEANASTSYTPAFSVNATDYQINGSGVWSRNAKNVRIRSSNLANETVKSYYFNDSELWGWWDLGDSQANETAERSTIDLSGNGTAGALGNATVISQPTLNSSCVVGKCLNFDGVHNFVSMGDSLNFTTDFTFAVWAYATSAVVQNSLVTKWTGTDGMRSYWFLANNNRQLSLLTSANGIAASSATSTGTFSLNAWHHLAVVKNGTLATFYIDGAAAGTGTTSATIMVDTSPAYIGAVPTGSVQGAFFNGVLDDVKVWNRNLSATEISQLYNRGEPAGYAGMESNATQYQNIPAASLAIGTSAPNATLTVTGSGAGDALLVQGNASIKGNLSVDKPGEYIGILANTHNNTLYLNNPGPSYYMYLRALGGAGFNRMDLGYTTAIAETAGTPVLTVTSGGKVGIGTTAPSDLLTIRGSNYGLTINSTGNAPGITLNSEATTGGNGNRNFRLITGYSGTGLFEILSNTAFGTEPTTSRLAINGSTGNIGIGTANPVYRLDVRGDVNATGSIGAASFIDYTPYYEGNALEEIMRIKGKNGEIDHATLPVFAQRNKTVDVLETREKEIEVWDDARNETIITLVSETVKVGEENEPGRDLGAMISVLTVAVQQLKTKNDALEADNTAMKKVLCDLNPKLEWCIGQVTAQQFGVIG